MSGFSSYLRTLIGGSYESYYDQIWIDQVIDIQLMCIGQHSNIRNQPIMFDFSKKEAHSGMTYYQLKLTKNGRILRISKSSDRLSK